MKVDISQVKKTIDQHMNFLRQTYHVKDMGVFGSVASGQNKETSDIDLLVEFSQPVGMFKFIELEEYLSKILKRKVDLVTKKALKPAIADEILREVIYV